MSERLLRTILRWVGLATMAGTLIFAAVAFVPRMANPNGQTFVAFTVVLAVLGLGVAGVAGDVYDSDLERVRESDR